MVKTNLKTWNKHEFYFSTDMSVLKCHIKNG